MRLLVKESEITLRLYREFILKMSDKLSVCRPLSVEPSLAELNDKLKFVGQSREKRGICDLK